MNYPGMKLVGQGKNTILGDLLCYSCEKHCGFSHDDKHISFDSDYHVLVFPDGRLELWSGQSDLAEFHEVIIHELNGITARSITSFGCGVTVEFFGARLQCSSCGSEEFFPLED